MLHLVLSSLLFSFSFGLIGRYLGGLDAVMVAFVRLLVAMLVFLPWLRPARLPGRVFVALAGIGAIQYGLMYIVYIYAFRWLSGHEVALYTVLTPLYVVGLHALRRRSWQLVSLAAALLATLGGAILAGRPGGQGLGGVLLIQVSNLCFAVGQLEYKYLCQREPGIGASRGHFAVLYAGGAALAGVVALLGGHWQGFVPDGRAWAVLLYLGAVPSALGFFFWNRGAREVRAGILAAANNLKIPLAVVVSLLVFREPVVWARFLPGVVILLGSLLLPRLVSRARATAA